MTNRKEIQVTPSINKMRSNLLVIKEINSKNCPIMGTEIYGFMRIDVSYQIDWIKSHSISAMVEPSDNPQLRYGTKVLKSSPILGKVDLILSMKFSER
jgi:hypothetical protein